MRIPTSEVRNGKHNGKTVWICHYLQPDLNKKPLRNLPPTKCVIADNGEISKQIYYSESHFKKVGKNGSVTKTVYSPVDNTGYRSRHGNELYVFEEEVECKEEFITQVRDAAVRVQDEINSSTHYWQSEKRKLVKMMLDNAS